VTFDRDDATAAISTALLQSWLLVERCVVQQLHEDDVAMTQAEIGCAAE
jgi:uncharacterized MnhB-related membrane protein